MWSWFAPGWLCTPWWPSAGCSSLSKGDTIVIDKVTYQFTCHQFCWHWKDQRHDKEKLLGGKSQRGLGRSLREEGAVSRWSSTSLSSSSPWLIITGWHSDKGASGNGGEIDASAEPFPNEAKKVIEWLSLPLKYIRPSNTIVIVAFVLFSANAKPSASSEIKLMLSSYHRLD